MTDLLGPFQLFSHDRLASTNTQAERLLTAAQPLCQPAIIWALEQDQGRGRQGRTWHSPIGNLYATFVFPSQKPALSYPLLSLAAAVAVAETVKDFTQSLTHPPLVQVKWPNDVLLNGCKVSGLLLETISISSSYPAILVGIGMNVENAPPTSSAMLYPPTSLKAQGLEQITVFQVLDKLQAALWQWYHCWLRGEKEMICNNWQQQAAFLNEAIEIYYKMAPLKGTFKGINQEGHMILQTTDGQDHTIMVGDVLRPM